MADLKADIEKYLSGKLSPSEMHALEKKALDDPFLAEALEGGSLVSPEEFIADVVQLQKSINEKTTGGKTIYPIWWRWPQRIAAGLLLLAASTYIVLNLVNKENNKPATNSIALNKSVEEPQASSGLNDSVLVENNLSAEKSSQPSPSEKREQSDRTIASEPEQKHKDVTDAEKKSDDFISLDNEDKAEEIEHDEVIENEKPILATSPVAEETKDEDFSRAKRRATEKESRQELRDIATSSPSGAIAPADLKTASIRVKGKVTDIDDGLPLPGVNVLVEGTSIGTVTDLNGNYEIDVPEAKTDLVFSFIGMESMEVVVNDKSGDVNVQLTPDVSELSEVVVTGYGTGEEPPSMENIKWEITEPEGGKKVYRNYLEQNLHYPEVAIKNNIEGKVTVQFTVEPNGQLTDFRVVKSLGNGCDDEVIRLIKEGPKWRPTKRNDEPVKSKAKVKMRFELPGKKK